MFKFINSIDYFRYNRDFIWKLLIGKTGAELPIMFIHLNFSGKLQRYIKAIEFYSGFFANIFGIQ